MTIIPPFVGGPYRTNRLVPFTMQDGETYLAKLARMATYLEELKPFIDEAIANRDEDFEASINGVITTVNAAIAAVVVQVNTALDAQDAEVGEALTQALDDADALVTTRLAALNAAFADLQAELEAYQEDQASSNDPIVAQLLAGPSATATQLQTQLASAIDGLRNSVNADLAEIEAELDTKSDNGHTHNASATTAGIFDPARIPAATTGAKGSAALATQANVNAGVGSDTIVTPVLLSAFEAFKRPARNRMVVVGSSNAVVGADYWPAKLGAAMGLIVHNYSIAGSAYTNANNFDTQVQNAVAGLTATQRAEVAYFFVADASNNSRAKTPYVDVFNNAVTTFSRIRDWFVNAKIVVIPQIWPSDTQKYAPSAFPYEAVWNGFALEHAQAQRVALENFTNWQFLDDSWTWLTGRDSLMTANNDVHPNASGHTVIARMIQSAFGGGDVTPQTLWTPATVTASSTLGGRGRPLAAKRDGWDVMLEGSATWATNGASGWDIATVPYGFRPTYNVAGVGIRHGSVTGVGDEVPFEVWPSGAVRVYQAINSGDGLWLNIGYRIG